MEGKRRTTTRRTTSIPTTRIPTIATAFAFTTALTLTLTLTACGSSSSSAKTAATSANSGAVGAPSETSASGSAATTGTANPASGDSAKNFCDDLRGLDTIQAPQVGKPVPPSTLAVFDRLAGEAPAQIKDPMKAAAAAVHGMSGKVDVAGLTAWGTAIKSVTTWASDPAHCPVS